MSTTQSNPIIFTPNKWFWRVAASLTQVYSSENGDYVPLSDAKYQAFLARGLSATPIDSEINLAKILADNLLRPNTPSILDAYKDIQAEAIVDLVQFKVLFDHENRIRALEGKPPITVAQAKAGIKSLM